MQIGSATQSNPAIAQLTRSVEQVNQLNQNIVDASQDLASKFIKMSAESKVQASAENQIDTLA